MLIALTAPQVSPRATVIQSVDLVASQTPVTFNQEGRTQLVHELHVTNFLPVEISLTTVQVKAVDGRMLAEYKDPIYIGVSSARAFGTTTPHRTSSVRACGPW